ncbi:MAG: acyl carrier protein [Candidatus Omnitrophica bacterium]|nr:acyl carrier protein [Candidatus Omnitrophota bacterium]
MGNSNFDTLQKEIKELVAEIGEIPEEEIKDDSRLVEDLGIDSMMALEIVAKLEKKYKVSIPEEKIPTITSLTNIYELFK